MVASLLPVAVVEQIRELRSLSPVERRTHLGITLRRVFTRRGSLPPGLTNESSVLFVCHGNIIRSALAEALFARHVASLSSSGARVQSAGLSARAGREADARAVAAGRALGVDLEAHRAQPLTQSLVDDAHVIFVMDRLNEAMLLARFPGARAKLRRLGMLAMVDDSDVIPDPYVMDAEAVREAAIRIDDATARLAALLNENERRPT